METNPSENRAVETPSGDNKNRLRTATIALPRDVMAWLRDSAKVDCRTLSGQIEYMARAAMRSEVAVAFVVNPDEEVG